MKTGFLITARLKSTRLPEKLLREVCGRPILGHMLDRIKLAQRVDQIVVCTSTHPQDDRLEAFAREEGVACFRGEQDDVLKRLADAAHACGLDYVLNITADCPFVDPAYADRIVDTFITTDADLIRALDLPHGAYSYGIKPSALQQILEIKDDVRTEVWGRYFTDTDLFHVHDLLIEDPLHRQPQLRMTLDYPEDLAFFEAVFERLYRPGHVFSLDDILGLLKANPELVEINRACAMAYQKRWQRQSSIKLKPRRQVRRAAILGCGSIGQRHISNLRTLGVTDVVAVRSRRGFAQALDSGLGVSELASWDALIDAKPDVAIISNPTSLHLETLQRVLPHVRGVFIEKPLSASWDGVPELLAQIRQHKVVSFIGYQLPFHPAVRLLRQRLADEQMGAPLVFQGQVGQWLPDWHPYEDFRTGYYARPELGGGVLLTLSHEVHLAQELFGPVQSVTCLMPASARLPLAVDVIADLMLQHASGAVSQLHLDYLQRPMHRGGVVSCEHGWLQYDLAHPRVLTQTETDAMPRVIWDAPAYDNNEPYVEQLRTFLQYVREGRIRHDHDAWNAARTQAILQAALTSVKTGTTVEVSACGLDA